MKQDKSGGIAETVRTVLYAVLIAFGVRTFAYEPFNIPSGSMIPTLEIGDYLFVSKLSYGYSSASVGFGVLPFDGRVLAGEPQLGDVVVFKNVRDGNKDYIKRVMGMPGDRIQVIAGQVHINGQPLPVERVEDPEGQSQPGVRYWETLPNGRRHMIQKFVPIGTRPTGGREGDPNNTGVYVVPADNYFMMGDNRDNSQDSRFLNLVGYVPFDKLVGRAEVIFFSLQEGTRFWEIWEWPFALRLGRFFDGVS